MATDRDVFHGGVAVITGAGAGIGEGFARRAAALGMTVIVADIAEARADKVVADIRAAGGQAHARRVDVSVPAELDRLAAEVAETFGNVRLLVNNAGVETLGYIWEIPAERWEATLNTNIHGVVHGVRAFVPYMLAAGEDAYIANLASLAALGSMPTQTAYILTKHAVQAFSEGLFLELKARNAPIHVSSVMPGLIRTSIFATRPSASEAPGADRYRKVWFDLLDQHGMDPLEAAERFLVQIAERRFWVFSDPDAARTSIEQRVRFLQGQEDPSLSEMGRKLLADQG